MNVSIRTSDYSFYGALKNANIDGLSIMICFTDSIPEIPPQHLHYVVISATPVSIKLLAKWLYDKFKNQPDEQPLINGNQLNFQSMSIGQIANAIRGEKEGEQGHRETD